MIKSFSDTATADLFTTGKSRRLPTDIHKSGRRALLALNSAGSLTDLRGEGRKLERYDDGRYTIRINDRYRVFFRWDGKDAHDVKIADPH